MSEFGLETLALLIGSQRAFHIARGPWASMALEVYVSYRINICLYGIISSHLAMHMFPKSVAGLAEPSITALIPVVVICHCSTTSTSDRL